MSFCASKGGGRWVVETDPSRRRAAAAVDDGTFFYKDSSQSSGCVVLLGPWPSQEQKQKQVIVQLIGFGGTAVPGWVSGTGGG